jgi:hypothetical protein
MENKTATIKNVVSIADDTLYAMRHTCETIIANKTSFHPMLTFFSSEDKVALSAVVNSSDNFEQTLVRISESLYLYPPLKAHAVMIAINSDLHDDSGNYLSSSLNVFTLSEIYGFFTTMPYTVDSQSKVTWHDDKFETVNVLDGQFEGISKEMVNLFYMFTHMDYPPYTVQEVLSYLSFVGTIVNFHETTPISFYDMTP